MSIHMHHKQVFMFAIFWSIVIHSIGRAELTRPDENDRVFLSTQAEQGMLNGCMTRAVNFSASPEVARRYCACNVENFKLYINKSEWRDLQVLSEHRSASSSVDDVTPTIREIAHKCAHETMEDQ